MSDTTGWKRDTTGNYFKQIGILTFWIFPVKRHDGRRAGYWFVRNGHRHGKGYVGEYLLLSDAKRAAHEHAEQQEAEA